MIIKIKLSTGKEIELTQEEYAELIGRGKYNRKKRILDYPWDYYPNRYLTYDTYAGTCTHN